MADPTDEIREIRDRLDEHALQLNYAQKLQDISSDFHALKTAVDEMRMHFRVIVVIGSLLLTAGGIIGGIVGFHNLDDANRMMTHKLELNIAETNEFYGDVMSSSVLFSQGRYEDAIPKLLKWFNKGEHTYDKTILIPLLASLNSADDWTEARPVIGKLRSNPEKFDQINDPSVYTIVGSIEVQLGITDLDSTRRNEADDEMQQGDKLLEHTYSVVGPNQNDLRRIILTNEWLYHVAKQEFDQAQQNIVALKNLPAGTMVYSWEHLRKWTCMAALARRDHADTMRKAEEQWKELKDRYFPVKS